MPNQRKNVIFKFSIFIKALVSLVLLMALLFCGGLYSGLIQVNTDGDGGFPQNLHQAGECFFGNYTALLNSFQANINNNKIRLAILKKNHDEQIGLKNQTFLKDDSKLQKETNVLNDSNRALNRRISEMEGKCLYFPKWD